MRLEFKVRREGRAWLAFLRRPLNNRVLFYVGPTKYEALTALLNGVARMGMTTPERLFGADWAKAANARAAAKPAS